MSATVAFFNWFLRLPLSCMRVICDHIFPASSFGTQSEPGNSSGSTIRPPYLLDSLTESVGTGSSRTRVVPRSVVGDCHGASVAWTELIRLPLPSPMYEGRGHISALVLYIHGVDACLLANKKNRVGACILPRPLFHNQRSR